MHAYIYTHTLVNIPIRDEYPSSWSRSIYAPLVNRSASGWRMKWCARRISHVHHVKYLLCKWYVGRGEARQRSEARDISVLFGVDRWKIIGRPTIIRVGETFPHIPQRDHANGARFVGEGTASIGDLCLRFGRQVHSSSFRSQGRVRSCRVS